MSGLVSWMQYLHWAGRIEFHIQFNWTPWHDKEDWLFLIYWWYPQIAVEYNSFQAFFSFLGGGHRKRKTQAASMAPMKGLIQYTRKCSQLLCVLFTYAQPNACTHKPNCDLQTKSKVKFTTSRSRGQVSHKQKSIVPKKAWKLVKPCCNYFCCLSYNIPNTKPNPFYVQNKSAKHATNTFRPPIPSCRILILLFCLFFF